MAHVSKVPISRLIAEDEAEEAAGGSSQSRGDYKKARELEELRKAGSAPAAVDEHGKDINPHIPQYISDAPWYLDPKGPTLSHQRPQDEKQEHVSSIEEWYPKGQAVLQSATKVPTKYRKGACANCGAMTHKKKDCLERPRKVGAKFSGSNFAPDERILPKLSLTFDGKRDRWNGYDNFAHTEVLEEYQKLEEVKKEVKRERLKAGLGNPEEDDGAQSSDEDEDKYVDKMDMPGTKVDAAERYTVRNLRIREDTAKYLRNLDPNSAYYDPKTRAMRKNPYENTGRKEDEVDYAGDNFVRVTGDTVEHARAQLFAWEAGSKGLDVQALAEPTKLEALKREYMTKKTELKDESKSKIFDKYGGEEHLQAPPRELIFAQTEQYVEYSRTGKVIKGQENSAVKSRYAEDVYPNNHQSVWGSYWAEGKWGYKCCHAFLKNSYCTGDAGKAAFKSNSVTALATASSSGSRKRTLEDSERATTTTTSPPPTTSSYSSDEPSTQEEGSTLASTNNIVAVPSLTSNQEEQESRSSTTTSSNLASTTEATEAKKSKKNKKKKKKKKSSKKKKRRQSSSASESDDNDEPDFEEEVKSAMRKQMQDAAKADEVSLDERNRKGYHSNYETKAPTEAELEAHARLRTREEDPMNFF